MATNNFFTALLKPFNFIAKLIEKESNESSKRAIAGLFAVSVVVAYYTTTSNDLKELILWMEGVLILLLLGIATIEQIINLTNNRKQNN